MPKLYKQHLLASKKNPESHYLESPLDTPELPEGHEELGYYEDNVRTLVSWKAPSRPYRKKDKSYYFTTGAIVALIALIAIFAGYAMLVVALFALLFLIYVLNFVAPEEVDYKLSTQGVTISSHFYHWQELDSFWVSEREGHKLLNIATHLRFPTELMLVLGEMSDDKVKRICAQYLPFHEIAPQTVIDKWSEKLQKTFDLEKP